MSVASDGSSSKLLEVEEHAFAEAGRWWREAGDMEVHVTSQHVLYYCTYYSVSFTCTVHCTYYIYRTLYTVHVPCFPVSDVEVSSSTSVHTLVHLYEHNCISSLVHSLITCVHTAFILTKLFSSA